MRESRGSSIGNVMHPQHMQFQIATLLRNERNDRRPPPPDVVFISWAVCFIPPAPITPDACALLSLSPLSLLSPLLSHLSVYLRRLYDKRCDAQSISTRVCAKRRRMRRRESVLCRDRSPLSSSSPFASLLHQRPGGDRGHPPMTVLSPLSLSGH